MNISIEPLTHKRLAQAFAVLSESFPDPKEKSWYEKWFTLSLDPEKNKKIYEASGTKLVKYYLAIDLEKDRVIGTTGIYSTNSLPSQTYGLGWFCVDKNYRDKKIGSQILDFTINEAKRLGGNKLELWTTDEPESEVARNIYLKRGFTVIKEEQDKEHNYKRIYMQLSLDNQI
jgi:GNAT superfamily N-acetyltransferase